MLDRDELPAARFDRLDAAVTRFNCRKTPFANVAADKFLELNLSTGKMTIMGTAQ